MSKIVIFDLGKVLLDFDYTKAAKKLLPLCGSPLKVLGVLNSSGLLEELEAGEISDDEFYDQIAELAKFRGTKDDFLVAFGDIFTPIEETIGFQKDLKKQGISTYIFSNTNNFAVQWISTHYPFYNNFTGYFLSYQLKITKPHDNIYAEIEKRTGKNGKDIIFFDDKQENIETALKRGWSAILFKKPASAIAEAKRLLTSEN